PDVGVGPRDVGVAVVVDQGARRRRVEAGVSAGDGERGERGGGEDGVGGGGVEAAQALRQGVVEGAQGVGAPEGVEEVCGLGGQLGGPCGAGAAVPSPQPLSRGERGSGPRAEFGSEPAENSASRAWISSGSNRCAWTPGCGDPAGACSSMPRLK